MSEHLASEGEPAGDAMGTDELMARALEAKRSPVAMPNWWGWASVAALFAGSIGPWVTVGPFSVGGGADKNITLIAAAAAAVVLGMRKSPGLVAVIGAIAALVGAIDTIGVSGNSTAIFSASVGWGLIVVDLAAVSLMVWGVKAAREHSGGGS